MFVRMGEGFRCRATMVYCAWPLGRNVETVCGSKLNEMF